MTCIICYSLACYDVLKVVEHALALEEAGCFSIVLECLPPLVSAAVTSALSIPTIGIGAGPSCSGQVYNIPNYV